MTVNDFDVPDYGDDVKLLMEEKRMELIEKLADVDGE